MTNYSTSQWSKAFALFTGIFFVICFFWSLTLSDLVLYELHMNSLRMTFPGFTGMNAISFTIGLIESIFFGLVVGWGIATCLNKFASK